MSPHNQPQYFIAPCNQPHQNKSPHHHHGTAEGSFTQKTRVWASQWLVTLCTFYRQSLSLTYSFFFETSAPGLPGSTSIYIRIYIYIYTYVRCSGSYRDGEPSSFQVSSLLALMTVCLQTVTALPFAMLTILIVKGSLVEKPPEPSN